MDNEIEELVAFKDTMDQSRKIQKAGLTPGGEQIPSIWPSEFLKRVLPFWNDNLTGEESVQEIDPCHVIGGNFRDYSEEPQTPEICKQMNRSTEKSPHYATYLKVGSMNLYVAREGKNRVSLFKKNRLPIVATIKETSYPRPNELKLHKSFFNSQVYYLSYTNRGFSDKRDFEQLPFPQYTVPLLKSYGVKLHKKAGLGLIKKERQIIKEWTNYLMRP